jgi:OmpA-OmpF porin, OOP family
LKDGDEMKFFSLVVLVAAVFLQSAGFLQAKDCPAISNIKDYPNLPVYNGACLIGGRDGEFAKFKLATGPMVKGTAPTSIENLEGTLDRRLYLAPEGTSATDLFQNYSQGLEVAGYSILFTCAGSECGSKNALLGKKIIYPSDRRLKNIRGISDMAFGSFGDEHYLAARSKDGATSVAVYVAFNTQSPLPDLNGRALAHLDILTTASLEGKMIDAEAMAKGISSEGHVAVDNVYFEFGTAKLTAEAEPALAEMTKLLKDNPTLKVYIVGHTDNVGTQDTNLPLSRTRAEAVVAAILKNKSVSPDRAIAAGVGALSPVASNNTDEGRKSNRRVELVER